MKKRAGFTLAEVLITLSIIGIIASFTLPSLNTNTTATRNRVALKKAMSTLSNAAMINAANFGWDFSGVVGGGNTLCKTGDGEALTAQNSSTICGLLNSSLSGEEFLGQLQYGIPTRGAYRIVNPGIGGSDAFFINYQLSDGMIIGLNRHATGCTQDMRSNGFNDFNQWCGGYIDVNGTQGPNRVVQCSTPANTKALWDAGYATCDVNPNDASDIFPIVFYNNNIELSTNAGKAYAN